jgi:hypothetical protein
VVSSIASDDTQVLVWHSRQLNTAFAVQQLRVGKPLLPDFMEAPRGVLGYRVDVRELGAAQFNSLTRVKGLVQVGQPAVASEGEQPPRAHSRAFPRRHRHLGLGCPRYFAQWRGGIAGKTATMLAQCWQAA